MSIFVSQSSSRAPRLSGLGAYAQLLPQVRARGMEALISPMMVPHAVHRASVAERTPVRMQPYGTQPAATMALEMQPNAVGRASAVRRSPVRMGLPFEAGLNPMRGMGDMTTTLPFDIQSVTPSSAAVQQLSHAATTRIALAADALRPVVTSTAGTLCDDPITGELVPCTGAGASMSIEGALPRGIAFLLAGAVGLTLVSMFVK